MSFSFKTIICILIIFILILFTLLLFNIGKHTRSNRYLGYYFISQIVVLFNISFSFFPVEVYFIVQSFIFSWGAFYFLFVSSLLDPKFSFKPKFLLHFVSVPIGLFLILAGYYKPVNNFFLSGIPFLAKYGKLASDILFNGLIIGYNVATIGKYYQFKRNT